MAEAVYVLCAMTSLACAWLLMRGYAQTGIRLLLWTGLCFGGLAVNNTLLFVDLVVVPDVDLSVWRGLTAGVGLGVLIFGLIWEGQ